MKILAGDIGGTNARLAIFEGDELVAEHHYPSKEFDSFEDILASFERDLSHRLPDKACIAVAGVVDKKGRVKVTNQPWGVDATSIKTRFNFSYVKVVNDFEAAAWGIMCLKEDDFVQIGGGEIDREGTRAVLGAGSGLGEALIVYTRSGVEIIPTEGGHTDFAPRNKEELGLLEHLLKSFDHVSIERILSGPGLKRIYDYLKNELKMDEDPLVAEKMKKDDPAAVITDNAIECKDSLCSKALDMFCSIYGAEAGNLALKSLSTGGVYVAGGIAPRIITKLTEGSFREAFQAKGRMEKILKKIPLYIVTDTRLGLRGAAYLASQG